MASGCTGGYSGWVLGEISSPKSDDALVGTAAQGGGGDWGSVSAPTLQQ